MSEESVFHPMDSIDDVLDGIDLGDDPRDATPERVQPGKAPVVPANHSTEQKYVDWIAEWRKTHEQKNNCYPATQDAARTFPELTVCRGWALYKLDLEWVKDYECWDQHWWCEAPDGSIVDPTCEQWLESRGGVVYGYEKYDPQFHGPEPIGKCMECGALIFPGDWDDDCNIACCEDHYQSLKAYYNIQDNFRNKKNAPTANK